jgi:hypothetical protein
MMRVRGWLAGLCSKRESTLEDGEGTNRPLAVRKVSFAMVFCFPGGNGKPGKLKSSDGGGVLVQVPSRKGRKCKAVLATRVLVIAFAGCWICREQVSSILEEPTRFFMEGLGGALT